MTIDDIKRVIDAFYLGKRIIAMLPSLPDGITPLYIRYLDIIGRLEEEMQAVKVSDIGSALSVQRPGVTRTVGEMVEKGLLEKTPSKDDGRVTFIKITPYGSQLSKKYNEEVFLLLTSSLPPIEERDVKALIKTTETIYSAMNREGGRA